MLFCVLVACRKYLFVSACFTCLPGKLKQELSSLKLAVLTHIALFLCCAALQYCTAMPHCCATVLHCYATHWVAGGSAGLQESLKADMKEALRHKKQAIALFTGRSCLLK